MPRIKQHKNKTKENIITQKTPKQSIEKDPYRNRTVFSDFNYKIQQILFSEKLYNTICYEYNKFSFYFPGHLLAQSKTL